MSKHPQEILTLLELAVNDRGPEAMGWRVIGRRRWERWNQYMELPDKSRLDLVDLVRSARVDYKIWRDRPPPDEETRKELKQILARARKLSQALGASGLGTRSAIKISIEEAYKQSLRYGAARPSSLDTANAPEFETLTSDVRAILERIEGAIQIAEPWQVSAEGGPKKRREYIREIHVFLLKYIGKGLSRTSVSKCHPETSYADACTLFVRDILYLISKERCSGKDRKAASQCKRGCVNGKCKIISANDAAMKEVIEEHKQANTK